MRHIDMQYLETPFYGWPRMTAALRRHGLVVNGKRVRRLMRQMGLQAITVRKHDECTRASDLSVPLTESGGGAAQSRVVR